MSPKKERSGGLGDVLKVGRRFLGGAPEAQARQERRLGKRVALPVPVRVKVADQSLHPGRVREVNLPGFTVEPAEGARVGEPVIVEFDGYPDVCPPFAIQGRVVRLVDENEEAMAVEVNRKTTNQHALKSYRSLVLHYLRHKPLLEDIHKGYFEGKCESCGWVGRVGSRTPRCSQCGGTQIVSV